MSKKKESASFIDTEKHQYAAMRVRDKSGKLINSRGNGDAIAKAFLLMRADGLTVDDIIDKVAKANKLGDRMDEHSKKPPGQRRMALGVMLRALVKAGTPVKIGKVQVEKLNQKVDMPKVEPKARAEAA